MVVLHDKQEIETFLRQNSFLHIFSIGDLDDFFWPYTIWYALKKDGIVTAIILFYIGVKLPTVLAFADQNAPMQALLQSVRPLLPRRFHAHLSPGLAPFLQEQFQLTSLGTFYKMGLVNATPLTDVDVAETYRLSSADLPAIEAFYAESYPENYFLERMLATGHYYAARRDGRIASIAGVHVYSEAYGVGALGNVATHPSYRRQGLGTAVTARLCLELRKKKVSHIGLNVKTDNAAALAVYQSLGFEIIASFES